MGNLFKCEQLKSDLSVIEDYDQTLKKSEIIEVLKVTLGEKNLKFLKIESTHINAVVYKNRDNEHLILFKAISYLGNPHPLHKKRIQMGIQHKGVFQAKTNYVDKRIHFVGVYHYEGLYIFVDFEPSEKIRRINNSSLHVNTNDLYQGLKNKIFHKVDKNDNKLSVIPRNYFKNYLDNELDVNDNELFDVFKSFNKGLKFNEWITIMEALPFMFENNGKWRQAEWAGFFLENKFSLFINENQLKEIAKYTASENKKTDWENGIFDFDIFFSKHNFYGDLKCSDSKQKLAIGNDQESFLECINKYERFWYIIYEHDTELDKEKNPDTYVGTRFRTDFIASKTHSANEKPLSYKQRLKYSICFKSMKILELNRINFRKMLSDFNQGKQPDGSSRKKKFLINKRIENDDNIVVFRYKKW